LTLTPGGEPENLLSDELIRDIEATRSQNRCLCFAVGIQRLTQKTATPGSYSSVKTSKPIASTAWPSRNSSDSKSFVPKLPNEPIADTEDELSVAIASPNPASFKRRE
jgi:hypothetical protein